MHIVAVITKRSPALARPKALKIKQHGLSVLVSPLWQGQPF